MASIEMPPPSHETAEQALRPLIIVCSIYMVLDAIFVAVRFASRMKVRQSEVGWDDWFILPSFVCNIGACIIGILIAHYESIGNGPANWPIFAPSQYYTQLVPTLKLIFALPLVLVPGFTFARVSILTLYLRIFTGSATRSFVWVIIGLSVAMGIGFELAAIFLCSPVNYFWNRQLPDGHCLDLNFYYRAYGLPNILIDVSILVVPIPAVWKLQASVGRKLGLSFMFLTGIIALVASCVRWAIYAHEDVALIKPDSNSELVYIDIIECSTYLIAACLPASYPVFNMLVPSPVRHAVEGAAHKILPTGKTTATATSRFRRNGDANSFARLVDQPGSREREREERMGASAKAVRVLGTDTGREDVESRPRGREEMVAMSDFGPGGRHGDEGVITVHTEIVVSQEERIDELMGF